MKTDFDMVVIGGGAAGLTAAGMSGVLGAKTALVSDAPLGGDCTWHGCVPSKSLLKAAKVAHEIRSAAKYGLVAPDLVHNWTQIMARVHSIREHVYEEADAPPHMEKLGVEIIPARARFIDQNSVEITDSRTQAKRVISSKRFIIATGSRPRIPKIEGIDHVGVLTNESLFELKEQPQRLLILGAGPIGMEMAQAHRRLGSKVTVIERGRCLSKDDEEHATLLLQRLSAEGVSVRQKTGVTAVRHGPRGIVLSLDEGGQMSEIEGSHLLVATGRSPRVDALGLDEAGVTFDKGGIVVDAKLRTNVHGVYAIGDVVAKAPHFTHIAAYHAGIAVQNALLLPYAKTDYASLPWVTYCDPELAHVGLSEADARKQHGSDVQLLRFEIEANDRAQTEHATLGSVKVWARKNGQVLGVSILAAHAGEMAHLWSLAIRSGLQLKAIACMISPYPTFGEASKSAAGELYKPKLFSPLAKRVVRLFSHLP